VVGAIVSPVKLAPMTVAPMSLNVAFSLFALLPTASTRT
jgi:hypothetical protein